MSDRTDLPQLPTPDDLENAAALYVLGLLDRAEALEFEQCLVSNPAAATVLSCYRSAAGLLGESVAPVVPPARVKDRILQAISPSQSRSAAREEGALGAIRSDEGSWKPSRTPGIRYKTLYFDKPSGLVTMLVRMEPGSTYPAHRHARTEQCLVLEGDLIHDDHVYRAGDFTWATAGSIDPALRTEHGNLLLIIAAPE